MDLYKNFPVLVIDNQANADTFEGRALRRITANLADRGMKVIQSVMTENDYSRHLELAGPEVSCLLLGWNKTTAYRLKMEISRLGRLISSFRERNPALPIFLLTEKLDLVNIPVDTISKINGYIWKTEDTPDFIAGRIENAVKKYLDGLLPPFFKALIEYAREYKYAWHTPGHTGGMAFLKSPAGRIFYEFFGENVFRSDLSVSVPELGSLLDHTDALREAEIKAAGIFGADKTYFVTNGTSTSNKIVLQGVVSPGDIVLVDRNCHKSVLQAIILTSAIPIYLRPSRNGYGIIGPIQADELSSRAIAGKIQESPLLKGRAGPVKITVITNSTYDGICYHVGLIRERLQENGEGLTENLLFDEAWHAHARFNPIYNDRYTTYYNERNTAYNLIFATQSTHKLLAAFSQASMIHVLDQRGNFSHDRFNQSFMMHSSTSPQYGIIASLDVAAKMMEGSYGRMAVQSAIDEANAFRKKMVQTGRELAGRGHWWFKLWQPEVIGGQEFDSVNGQTLNNDQACWVLQPDDEWHGFDKIAEDYAMLDPLKVTVLTPGMDGRATTASGGIPAPIVSKFLMDRGIVAEKTGFYSFLFLFTIGITNGKSGTLLAELFEFKRIYDTNLTLANAFPELAHQYSPGMTIQALCREMHLFLITGRYAELLKSVHAGFPVQSMTPARAYRELVANNVKTYKLSELGDKTSAVMVVPYPPGIPVIMPGERFNPALLEYLKFYEAFNNRFPGFKNDLHGVEIMDGAYSICCVDSSPA